MYKQTHMNTRNEDPIKKQPKTEFTYNWKKLSNQKNQTRRKKNIH